LIRFDKFETGPTANLNVMKNGKMLFRDFVPPKKIGFKREERGWNDHTFWLDFEEPNQFVSQVEATYTEIQRNGSLSENSSTLITDIEPDANGTAIRLTGLLPYQRYSVTFRLLSEAGRGPESETKKFQTLANSPPFGLEVMNITTKSATIKWLPPRTMAENITIESFDYELMTLVPKHKVEESQSRRAAGNKTPLPGSDRRIWDRTGKLLVFQKQNRSHHLTGLTAGSTFKVRLMAKSKVHEPFDDYLDGVDQESSTERSWATLQFSTLPETPAKPEIVNATASRMTLSLPSILTDRMAPRNDSHPATFNGYEISCKLNNTEDEMIIQRLSFQKIDDPSTNLLPNLTIITGLEAGEVYQIKLRILTSQGHSGWSKTALGSTANAKKSSAMIEQLDQLNLSMDDPEVRENLEDILSKLQEASVVQMTSRSRFRNVPMVLMYRPLELDLTFY